MAKRLFDLVCAGIALIVCAPLIGVAMLGIKLTSPGPAIYRATRTGLGGRPFTMYKLRTMDVDTPPSSSRITARQDPRVFPFGRLLRASKVDELPQLINILRGEMSVIGPRPEHPDLVAEHFTADQRLTLAVRPGLASPGSLYHDTHGEHLLTEHDTETAYVQGILPIKLALDLVYVQHVTVWYDIRLVWRTIVVITGKLMGRRHYTTPPELEAAQRVVARSPSRRAVAILLGLLLMSTAGCDLPGGMESEEEEEVIATMVGAGDISRCEDPDRDDEATAKLLDTIPGTVFTLGDNTYPSGTVQEFEDCYHPTWGRHLERTRPSVGNHEYETGGAAPYYNYFGAAAGNAGEGYYSYELGAWHIIVLNSEINMGDDSEQHAWLRDVLAQHDNRCMMAYWHKPRFNYGTTEGTNPDLEGIWETLYDAGVDVILNGHEHNYQRYPPMTPSGAQDAMHGIQQFTIGTGGGDTHPVGSPFIDGTVRSGEGAAGVMVFTLRPDAYEWQFVPIAGRTFTETGERACHDAPGANGLALLHEPSGTVDPSGTSPRLMPWTLTTS